MNITTQLNYADFTILITDDDPNIVFYLQRVISKKGFQVKVAQNTLQAKEILDEFKIDIILLDVNMPGETGLEFCQKLRKEPRFQLLPIIFITAIDKEIGLEESISHGGDDFLNKPVDVKSLMAKLHSFCRIKSLQDIVVEQNQRYSIELKMARKVQELLNPQKNFEWNGCSIHTYLKPFIQIGGDYADVWTENEELHIIIADSIGHGPSGALLSAMFKMQLSTLPKKFSLMERVQMLRNNLIQVIPPNYMITFFYGILYKDLTFQYINGGNPLPLIYHSDQVEELSGTGKLIINLDNPVTDRINKQTLQEGSYLLLYTDGASEAVNSELKMLDTDGLKEIFKNAIRNGNQIIPEMMNSILDYCGKHPPQDDIAFILIKVKP